MFRISRWLHVSILKNNCLNPKSFDKQKLIKICLPVFKGGFRLEQKVVKRSNISNQSPNGTNYHDHKRPPMPNLLISYLDAKSFQWTQKWLHNRQVQQKCYTDPNKAKCTLKLTY